MKGNYKYGSWIFVFLCFCFSIYSCKNSQQQNNNETAISKSKDIYYCPMHPEIQQDHTGKCPKPECMGMDLVKKVFEDIMNTILQPVNESVLANAATTKPIDTIIPFEILAQGFVDYDNCVKKNIASTVSGRIEKLYIKTNFQTIKQGERVMDVYSPELVTAQENLLYLLNNESEDNSLVLAAKEKLKVLGMNDVQINSVCKNKKPQRTVAVYSKWTGVVRVENQTLNSNNDMPSTSPKSNGMNETDKSVARIVVSSISLKEGMYVNEGQTIFNVVDPKKPVVMLQVKEKDIAAIRNKQKVSLTINDNDHTNISGVVDFIEPLLNNSKTTLVRVVLKEQSDDLKTGMLVEGKIETDGIEGVFIPTTSVMDAGRNKYVWLKKERNFQARKIEVGAVTKDWIEIYDGINEKDEIAVQAHYLLDSEGFLKTEEDATE